MFKLFSSIIKKFQVRAHRLVEPILVVQGQEKHTKLHSACAICIPSFPHILSDITKQALLIGATATVALQK